MAYEAVTSSDPLLENATAPSQSEFSLSIPLVPDDDGPAELGFHDIVKTPEQTEPREHIAHRERRDVYLQAQLDQPFEIGTFHGDPAMLLCFRFTFQQVQTGANYRIKQAKIELEFEDAPLDKKTKRSLAPVIKDFEPRLYHGSVSTEEICRSVSLKTTLSGNGQITADVEYTRSVVSPREGRLTVQGLKRPFGRQVSWTILENEVLKSGIPLVVVFPVLVQYNPERRFSASISVSTRLGWNWSGVGKSTLGSSDRSIYFDPVQLRQRIVKGDRAVKDGGCLTGDLKHLANVGAV